MNRIKLLISSSLALAFLCSSLAQAKPVLIPTSLKIPPELLLFEPEITAEILNLRLYPDSDDPDQYYYIPPFHVRQYNIGAATMLLNPMQIANLNDAKKELLEKKAYEENYIAAELLRMSQDVEKYRQELAAMKIRYFDAMEKANERLIKVLEAEVAFGQSELERVSREYNMATEIIASGVSIVPDGINKIFDNQALLYINLAGVKTSFPRTANAEERQEIIREAMRKVQDSEAGQLNLNIYAGFTKKQLEALKAFRLKSDTRHVKISLMPVENIDFFALSEKRKQDKDNNPTGTKFFSRIDGSGDYLGAAISLGTSVAAGTALVSHMGPFILPMGISAEIKHKGEPVEMDLKCDFDSSLYSFGERNIHTSSVTFIHNEDDRKKNTESADNICRINTLFGSQGSAEYLALQELEKQWMAIGLARTYISPKDKRNFIDENERKFNKPYLIPSMASLPSIAQDPKWKEWLNKLSASYPEFFYQNGSSLSTDDKKLSFRKHISLNGDQIIKQDLPVNLCLVYNPLRQAYDRCTEVEEASAETMGQAAEEIASSDLCAGIEDPQECGKLRDELGLLPKVNRKFTPDGNLVRSL